MRALPPFVSLVADGSRLHALVVKQPNILDLSVYFRSKLFRLLGSCKASDLSTPFRFHETYNEHTDELDALVTYAAHLPLFDAPAVSAIDNACTDRPRKRARAEGVPLPTPATTGVSDVQAVIGEHRERLDALQAALRALFVHYGDARTEVRYLVGVEGHSLRWELRNQGARPCLLNCTDHHSNNALVWLVPILTATGGHGLIKDAYEVKIQCTTERCGKPTGVIGRLAWDGARYAMEAVFPPQLVPTNRRPATFKARTEPLPGAATVRRAQPAAAQPVPPVPPSPPLQPEADEVASEAVETPPLVPEPPPAVALRSGPVLLEHDEADEVSAADFDENDGVDPLDPLLNTYELVKARFEKWTFKVRSTLGYAMVMPKMGAPVMCSESQCVQYNRNRYYFEQDPLTRDWVRRPFMRRWLGDTSMRTVYRIIVAPHEASPCDYNAWRGFRAERLPPVPDCDVDALVAPFVRHVLEVYACDRMPICDYLLDLFANILQRPHKPAGVVVNLFGLQGAGKGIVLSGLRKYVIGAEASFQTSTPDLDLVGRFAMGTFGKVFVQVDEVANMSMYEEVIKNLITSDTVRLERKNRDMIVVQNLCNLFATSNNIQTFKIPPDDRRFVMLQCSDRYRGNMSYMHSLATHLMRADASRAIYQMLMKRDLSKYVEEGFQAHRPETRCVMVWGRRCVLNTD